MSSMEVDEPTADDGALAQTVFQLWQAGNQQGAIDAIKPSADDGRPWALALTAWLCMQRGVPAIVDGVPYAKRAAELGMPWAAVNFFNNLIGNVAADATLLGPAMDLATSTGPWWSGIDPVGQGWNLLSQGHPVDGVRLMGLRAPFPLTEHDWSGLAAAASEHLAQITAVVDSASDARQQVDQAVTSSVSAIEKARTDLETSANQANLLVTAVVSDSAASLFKADADRNEEQSKTAWVSGLVVLGVAAVVAVTPLLLHYFGRGPDFSIGALLGAHAGATAALATVAGVLLARGRARDIARQRANDLSTAMGTMIAYSNQISDESERQRFMTTMGQLVLQAHLTSGGQSHNGDESMTGLIALANLVRAPGGATPAS